MNELDAVWAKFKCLQMVKGTTLNWKAVVRFKDTKHTITRDIHQYERDSLEFAVGVVEGVPVWKGSNDL